MDASQELHFEKVLKTCATFLQRWRNANAIMWELTTSHKSLRLVLSREGRLEENLVLSCLDPMRLRGPIQWEHSDLSISRVRLASSSDEGFLVVDVKADVEIVCGGVEVRENVKLY
jgi:hypothetical protein